MDSGKPSNAMAKDEPRFQGYEPRHKDSGKPSNAMAKDGPRFQGCFTCTEPPKAGSHTHRAVAMARRRLVSEAGLVVPVHPV